MPAHDLRHQNWLTEAAEDVSKNLPKGYKFSLVVYQPEDVEESTSLIGNGNVEDAKRALQRGVECYEEGTKTFEVSY